MGIDLNDRCPVFFGDKRELVGRHHFPGCSDDQENIRNFGSFIGSAKRDLGNGFTKKYIIGFQQSAALPAGGRQMIQVDVGDCIVGMAGKTNQSFGVTVKVENIFAPCFLVKVIDVLCDGSS